MRLCRSVQFFCPVRDNSNNIASRFNFDRNSAQWLLFFLSGYYTYTCVMIFRHFYLKRNSILKPNLHQDGHPTKKNHTCPVRDGVKYSKSVICIKNVLFSLKSLLCMWVKAIILVHLSLPLHQFFHTFKMTQNMLFHISIYFYHDN